MISDVLSFVIIFQVIDMNTGVFDRMLYYYYN